MLADETPTDPPIGDSSRGSPLEGRKGFSRLGVRMISAFVIAPVVIAATYFGEPYFFLMIAGAAALMAMEWVALVGARPPAALILAIASGLAVSLAYAAGPRYSILVLVFVATLFSIRRAHESVGRWMAAGTGYIGLPCSVFVWLRDMPDGGLTTVAWLFAVAWVTDTGAYLFGRAVGGPKLAPKLSPNKTWAGLLGGMACAGAAGGVMGLFLRVENTLCFVVASIVIGGISQGGDLFESRVKRRFDKKDSGAFMPGHGGILDRVDGLLAAIVFAGLLEWATDGSWRPWV